MNVNQEILKYKHVDWVVEHIEVKGTTYLILICTTIVKSDPTIDNMLPINDIFLRLFGFCSELLTSMTKAKLVKWLHLHITNCRL